MPICERFKIEEHGGEWDEVEYDSVVKVRSSRQLEEKWHQTRLYPESNSLTLDTHPSKRGKGKFAWQLACLRAMTHASARNDTQVCAGAHVHASQLLANSLFTYSATVVRVHDERSRTLCVPRSAVSGRDCQHRRVNSAYSQYARPPEITIRNEHCIGCEIFCLIERYATYIYIYIPFTRILETG